MREIEGSRARDLIETFTGRSVATLEPGRICYALRLGPSGEVLADLTIWRSGAQSYDVMSGRREDVADLLRQADRGISVTDITADMAVFAVQGPGSLDALRPLGDVGPIAPLGYFSFGHTKLDGIACRIGRLGYTGEAGFEIIVPRGHAHALWQALSAHARPAGFIAADMLRIEAGFVLFKNEFRLPVSASEAGLGKFCQSTDRAPPEISLTSFRADPARVQWPWEPSRRLQRPAAPGEIVVTSACESVAADGILGLGYVLAGADTPARLHDPAGVFHNIRPTPRPFYDTAKLRVRAPWR